MKLQYVVCRGVGAALLVGALMLVAGCGMSDADRVREAQRRVHQWDLSGAESVLNDVVAVHSEVPDSVRLLLGIVQFRQGDVRRARATLDGLDSETALRYRAQTHFFLGHPDTAKALSAALLQRGQSSGHRTWSAQAHHVLGLVGFYEARYEAALHHQRRSLELARNDGHLGTQADALRQIGVLYWYRGQPDSARTAFYEPALSLYRRIDDRMGEATVLSNIGLIHWQKGEWVQHARYQLRAFRLRREIGDQIGMADSYYFLAHLPHYIGYNNPGYVTTYYRKSVELSRRIGYAWGERVATEAWHRYLANSFDVASIRTKGAGRTEDRSGEARLFDLSTRADVAFQEERWSESARLFEEAYRMADSLDYYSMKRGSLRWKAAALRRGHRFAAASATLSALEALVEDDPRATNRDDVTLQKAHLLLDTGRHTRAEALLRPLAARYDSLYVATLAQANPSQAYERAAGAVHAMRRQIYLRLVQAALRRSPEAVLQYVERERRLPFWGEAPAGSRHRDAYGRFVRLLEELDTDPDRFHQVQELEAALGEVYQDRLAEETILSRVAPSRERSSLRAATPLQGALREGEVFAEYFVTDAEVVVIAVRRDTLHVQSVPIRRSALEAAVRVFRGTVRRGAEDPEDTLWRPAAHRLYDVLLTPLIENGLLHEGDRLLVAPHNSLRWVPVHALLPSPGSSSPFVIERYGVSYVPSGTDLVRSRRQPQRTLRSLYAVAPVSRALPETQREIQQLADLASFDVEGDAAHRPLSTELWHQFRDHDVVHIASHARMNAHFPLYSSIELSDRRLELHELVGRDLATPLVVLSACETGREGGAVNGVPTGADRVSFPRAFLAAGVENVVASYWRVEDAATADLMAAFYRALDATAPNGHGATAPSTSDRVAAALVQAQRRVIQRRRADGQPTHPFYWAGFYLTRRG